MFDEKRNFGLAILSVLAFAAAVAAAGVAANAEEGAGKTCVYNGQPFGPQESICKEGVVHVCDGKTGAWVRTDDACG